MSSVCPLSRMSPLGGRTSCGYCGTAVPSKVSPPPPGLALGSTQHTWRREDAWQSLPGRRWLPEGGVTDRNIPATSSPSLKVRTILTNLGYATSWCGKKKKKKNKTNFFPSLPWLKSCWGWPPGSTRPLVGGLSRLASGGRRRPSPPPEEPVGRNFSSWHRPLG